MANTRSATYKIYNGTDWDTYYFATSAGQVGETSTLKFLRPAINTVNGKAFTTTTGITLYGSDIAMSSSDTTTIYSAIEAINQWKNNAVPNTYLTMTDASSTYINKNQIGVASGVASLGTDGKVPSSQLPSYVDDVLEYSAYSSFPSTGEEGIIYVATDTNITYRWSGSAYVEISASLALGETSSTAYAGDKGKANATAIEAINQWKNNAVPNTYLTMTDASSTYLKISDYRSIFLGSTTPSGMKSGDIWLQY